MTGRARDISLCGLFVALPGPWPPLESKVRVGFSLPESARDFEIQARVVRHQTLREGEWGGVGIEFVEMPTEMLETVEGYVVGRFRSLRFLKRLLDDPHASEGHIREFIDSFGLDLSGTRAELQEQVEERLRYFRIRPPQPA